jgi:peptidoglycan/LPS O-acetylase OafA/YrhL
MSMGQFFKRRLIRLHPMLVMGAVMGFMAFALVGFERWDGTAAPLNWVMMALLLTMFMIPAVPGIPYEVRGNGEMFPLNGPAWSLFFEYIGNILYALFIRRLSTKMLSVLTIVLGVLHAWFFVGDVSGYGMMGVGWTIDEVNFWGGLLRMLFPFTLGMLLARTFKPKKVRGAFWVCSLVLIALFSVPYIESAGAVNLNCLYEFICVAFIFPALVWLGACGSITEGNKTTHRINKALGDLSYPLYIVHYPIMYIFYAWLIDNEIYTLSQCFGVATLVVLSSILLAILSLKLYDEPIRRWLSKKI